MAELTYGRVGVGERGLSWCVMYEARGGVSARQFTSAPATIRIALGRSWGGERFCFVLCSNKGRRRYLHSKAN